MDLLSFTMSISVVLSDVFVILNALMVNCLFMVKEWEGTFLI